MSKARNTGNLNNSIQITPSGDIRFMHDNNMLMQVSSSGVITTTGVISGSNALSASYAATGTSASYAASATSASYALNATTASYALSATSASFTTQAITASYADTLTVAGTLTAQTLVVQTITSSVDFVTGSTRFGSISGNTHQFTGSMSISGSATFSGSVTSNGTLTAGLANGNIRLKGSTDGFLGVGESNGTLYLADWATSAKGLSIVLSTGAATFSSSVTAGTQFLGSSNTTDPTGSTTLATVFSLNGNSAVNPYGIGLTALRNSAYDMFFQTGPANGGGYRWYIGTSEKMTMLNTGKVGIGTIDPSTLLQVAGLSTFGASNVNGDLTIISNGSPFAIRGRGDYDRPFLGLSWDTSPDTGVIYGNVLKFNTNTNWGTNAGSTALTILANGKVGIGETNPDNTYQGLTIKGSDPSLRLKTTGGSGWTWIEFVNSSGTNNFSMGVNQTSPYFGIKAGAGMDSVHFTMNSSGNIGMGEGASSIARLNVNGSTKMNRSFYNWYQGSWVGNSTYWHMKTSMWAGGSPNGNIQYTMSLFKGFYYSYSASILEGAVGFHNWAGTIYALKTTGNLFSNVYTSSDGYVVLVIPSGDGETGVTIDWHQAYGYPFVSAQVTAAKLHGATTGGY